MNPQFQELDSAISEQDKLAAQQLANQIGTTQAQSGQIALEQAQRKNESDMAVRAACRSMFKMPTPCSSSRSDWADYEPDGPKVLHHGSRAKALQ